MTTPFDHLTLLIDAEHLRQCVDDMAQQIQADLSSLPPEEEPTLVVVLKGGAMFGMDLLRALNRSMPVVFVAARNRPSLLSPQDEVLLHNRPLIIADALMDSGGSLRRLYQWLQPFQPRSIRLAVLLHKTVSHAEPLVVNYLGFEVPDVRLVGYGLDEEQCFRGLPAIYSWWAPSSNPDFHSEPPGATEE